MTRVRGQAALSRQAAEVRDLAARDCKNAVASMQPLLWDDLRVFLAVVRADSHKAAGVLLRSTRPPSGGASPPWSWR